MTREQLLALAARGKVYFVAAGLAGLALYELSVGQYDLAGQALAAALVAAGLRHETAPPPVPDAPPAGPAVITGFADHLAALERVPHEELYLK